MAKARPVPGIAPQTPMREAAARTVEVRAREVFSFADGVLDTSDIERVHDMRVATRRLRAALEVFEVCFPRKQYRRALKDVKRLADALGLRRDPDVQIKALEGYADELPADARPGIEALVNDLRDDQARGNEVLERELAKAERSALEWRLLALAAKAAIG
jgi:CHAD domain-containing protein